MTPTQAPVTTTTAAGKNVDDGDLQGLIAQSVTVQNSTSQYVFVPAASQYVRPYQTRSLPLNRAVNSATLLFQTPPGVVPNPVNAAEQCIAVWSPLAVSAAQPADTFTAASPQQLLGTFTAAANATTTSQAMTLPTGCQSVLVTWTSPTPTIAQPTSVSVLDGTLGMEWGSFTTGTGTAGSLSDTLLIVPVSTLVNSQVVVKVTEPAGVSHTVNVIALPLPAAVAATLQGSDVAINVTPPASQLCTVAAVSGAFSGVGTTTATLGVAGGQSTADFTLPAGTHTVTISGRVPWTLAQGVPVFQLQGVQSGTRYVLFQNGPLPLYANITPADTTVRLVVLDGGVSSPVAIQCTASFSPLIVPPPVILPTVLSINQNLAANGTALIISGTAGYIVKVISSHLFIDNITGTGGFYTISDTNSGTAFDFFSGEGVPGNPTVVHSANYGGAALSVGGGVQVQNLSSTTAELRGSISYVQQPAF